MGNREILLKLPTDYTEKQLKTKIEKELKRNTHKLNIKVDKISNSRAAGNASDSGEYSYQIIKKSLDARKKK